MKLLLLLTLLTTAKADGTDRAFRSFNSMVPTDEWCPDCFDSDDSIDTPDAESFQPSTDGEVGDLEQHFAALLQADTQAFITDLAGWVEELTEMPVAATTHFTLETSGNVDYDTPCGDLVAHHAFDMMQPFLKDPKHAKLHKKKTKKLLWHASKACMDSPMTLEVDGGTHEEFVMSCGNDIVLLNATSASGGLAKKFFFDDVELTGAFVAVEFVQEGIKAIGATGSWFPNIKYRNSPHHVDKLLEQWKDNVHDCATNGSLQLVGVVSGGWKEKKSIQNHQSKHDLTAVVGYAQAFEITMPSDVQDGSGSTDVMVGEVVLPTTHTPELPPPSAPYVLPNPRSAFERRSELQQVSKITSAQYVESGQQCAQDSTVAEEGECFMRTALTKVTHGGLAADALTMSLVSHVASTNSSQSTMQLLVIACIAVVAFVAYKTGARRSGYQPIAN